MEIKSILDIDISSFFISLNIYLISREPFKQLIAKLKKWYKNPKKLRRKFTLKHIKKVSSRYFAKKKQEIEDVL